MKTASEIVRDITRIVNSTHHIQGIDRRIAYQVHEEEYRALEAYVHSSRRVPGVNGAPRDEIYDITIEGVRIVKFDESVTG